LYDTTKVLYAATNKLVAATMLLFFFKSYVHHLHPHSFPTRRSSDLGRADHVFRDRFSDRHALRPDGRAAGAQSRGAADDAPVGGDRKSTRLNSSHLVISYAVFCLKKKIGGWHSGVAIF